MTILGSLFLTFFVAGEATVAITINAFFQNGTLFYLRLAKTAIFDAAYITISAFLSGRSFFSYTPSEKRTNFSASIHYDFHVFETPDHQNPIRLAILSSFLGGHFVFFVYAL